MIDTFISFFYYNITCTMIDARHGAKYIGTNA